MPTSASTPIPRIVIVDDQPADRRAAAAELSEVFSAARIETPEDAETLAAALDPDRPRWHLAVTEWGIPWCPAPELLEEIKARDPLSAIILHTGRGSEEVAAQALTAGFDRYVIKGGTPGQLGDAARTVIERIRRRRRMQERFSGISYAVENSSDAVLLADMEGTSRFHNQTFSATFGYSPEELNARGGPTALFADRDLGGRVLRALQEGRVWSGEADLVAASGEIAPVLIRGHAMRDELGNRASGLVLVCTDLSERKRWDETRARFLEQVIAAQEQERRRIARELHDSTGQALTGLLVRLRLLEDSIGQGKVRSEAREIRGLTAGVLDELGRIARGLHPSVLEDLGLAAALERYTEELGRANGLRIDVNLDALDGRRLPPIVEHILYRGVQEALTNVVKHAGAQTASVVVQLKPDKVRVIVEDDGSGFDTSRDPGPQCLGLHGLRERAALLKGTLLVESSPGSGTAVVLNLPLPEEPGEATRGAQP